MLGAPLQLGALSVRLVRLWVNPPLSNYSSEAELVSLLQIQIPNGSLALLKQKYNNTVNT